MKYLYIIFFLLFYSCSYSSIENFLGKPRIELRKLSEYANNYRIIDCDLESDVVFLDIKNLLYKNDADIYFLTGNEFFVRNLKKIYKKASNTTELYIKIDKNGERSTIKFTSFNVELIEYFVDNFDTILVAEKNTEDK